MFTFPVAHFGGEAAYEIDYSLAFDQSSSQYMSRTHSLTNRRTFTFSTWFRRGSDQSANRPIFTSGGDDWFMFLSSNKLGFNSDGTNNYRIVTSATYTSTSDWVHAVLRVDTTNSTAGDRLRLYIGGSEVTSFSTDTNPPLNYDTSFNTNTQHNVGKAIGSSQYYDGNLADTYFIDGSSLDADSFGETVDSAWVPKAYTGSFGGNSFFLEGKNSSDLGEDTSGEDNDYSNSGVTQSSDTPTS
jgi:hypothetical protein